MIKYQISATLKYETSAIIRYSGRDVLALLKSQCSSRSHLCFALNSGAIEMTKGELSELRRE